MATTRTKVLSDPRSGARPLGGSDPGPAHEEPRGPESVSKAPAPQRQPAVQSKPSSPASAPVARPAAAKSAGRPRQSKPGKRSPAPALHNYQGIILAEFVLAELLVAGTPIATRKGQSGLSPYVPRDMTKLLSIGMVYFLLQLMAVGGGKAGLGAWFGGLILLVVGMNEAANVSKVLDIFGGTTKSTS